MGNEPFHYVDIFTDPDWRAKADVIVGRVTAMDYKTTSAVVNMLEDGVIDPADVQRLRDGLAVYDYYRSQEFRQQALRDCASWFQRSPVSETELERQTFETYGPAGPPPGDDAPARVRQHYNAVVQTLQRKHDEEVARRLVPFRPAKPAEGGDTE